MLPGSAATHWSYTFLCACLMQHFVDIYLGLKFFQAVQLAQRGFPSVPVLPVAIATVDEYELILATKTNCQRAIRLES